MEPILQAQKITKAFGDTLALDNVDFDLYPGEIHGLCGANGSGKSTLLNILNGHSVIGETGGFLGELRVNGVPVRFSSPLDSARYGIGMVHQELALIGELDIAANICLGIEAGYPLTEKLLGPSLTFIDEKATGAAAKKVLDRMGIALEVGRRVRSLPVNLKQFVEIAREITRSLKVLILDEPTACLGTEEAQQLMEVLLELKGEGLAIILVSHRLEELQGVCDRVTVFRDGKRSASYSKGAIDPIALARDMVGETIIATQRQISRSPGSQEPILSLQEFVCQDQERTGVTLSLDIYKGEILGCTGLAGHGHNLLPYGLMNLLPWTGGAFYQGKEIQPSESGRLLRKGLFFLPDERKELGLLLDSSVEENMVFAARQCLGRFLHRLPFRGLSLMKGRESRTQVEAFIDLLGIRCRGPEQPVRQLSGGNQQKVCIARALMMELELLFVGEPTRGMDIHAKEVILEQLLAMNQEQGTAIVIASGELDELRRVCDRIAVFYEGKIVGVFPAGTPRGTLLRAMAGKGEDADE